MKEFDIYKIKVPEIFVPKIEKNLNYGFEDNFRKKEQDFFFQDKKRFTVVDALDIKPHGNGLGSVIYNDIMYGSIRSQDHLDARLGIKSFIEKPVFRIR